MFEDEHTNAHAEEQSCKPPLVSDDIVQIAEQQISERWCSHNFGTPM
jgi:hypothetical protein